MPRFASGAGRWLGLAVLLAAPLAALLWLRAATEDSLDAAETRAVPQVVSPTARTIIDQQQVGGTPTWLEGRPLRAPEWRGTVTSLEVKPGDSLAFGRRLLGVGGIARLAIASAHPFHRSLRWGDSGADVAQLHAVLARLGYMGEPRDPEVFELATRQAVVALEADLGAPNPQGIFDPAWFVWLPAEPFVVGELTLEVGAPAPAPGMAFARESARLTRLVLASGNQAEQLVLDPAVSWVLVQGGQRFAVDARALQVAETALPELQKLLKPLETRFNGTVQRAAPLNTLAIPSTAVSVGARGNLCAWLEDGAGGYRAQPVKVVGARSGVTNISVGLTLDSRVLANPAAILEQPACP